MKKNILFTIFAIFTSSVGFATPVECYKGALNDITILTEYKKVASESDFYTLAKKTLESKLIELCGSSVAENNSQLVCYRQAMSDDSILIEFKKDAQLPRRAAKLALEDMLISLCGK
jgi:hypothetical protein